MTFETGQDLCSWCYFGDGGGLGIVDLNNADRYTKVIRNIRTTLPEFNSLDSFNCNYPCNMLNSQNVLPFSRDGLTAGTMNASTESYTEPQYLNVCPLVNTALTTTRYLPLNVFKDTFFAVNKDSVFGRDMFIRFNTQYGNRMGIYATNPSNANATTVANASITTNFNMNGIYLFLALEENRMIIDSLLTSLESGHMKMMIPYTYGYRFGQAAGSTAANLTVTLSRNFGHKLKRVLYAPFVGNEYGQYAFDHSNVNGTKVSSLQSSIDSRPLTDYFMNCFNPNCSVNPTGVTWVFPTAASSGSNNCDDYREMRKCLMNSAITSYSQFQTNWCYADTWGIQSQLSQLRQQVDDSNIEDGLNLLDGDHVYTLQLNTQACNQGGYSTNTYGMAHYLWCLFVRNLVITPNGIAFE